MDTKIKVAFLVITAIGMAITPAILDTAFADKGGEPNKNSQKICVKGSDQKKCDGYDDDNEDGEVSPGEDNHGE